jgi:hypothetical protein
MEATLLKGNIFWKPYRVGVGSNVIIGSFLRVSLKERAASCLMDVPTAGPNINLTANLLPILRPQGAVAELETNLWAGQAEKKGKKLL